MYVYSPWCVHIVYKSCTFSHSLCVHIPLTSDSYVCVHLCLPTYVPAMMLNDGGCTVQQILVNPPQLVSKIDGLT